MRMCGEVERFKYLGSVLQKDGGFKENMKHKIKCGRMEWKEALGALYDKNISIRLNDLVLQDISENRNVVWIRILGKRQENKTKDECSGN